MTFHISPMAGSILSVWDEAGKHAAAAAYSAPTTAFMEVFSAIFDPMIVLVAACLIVAALLLRKKRFEAWRFLLSIISISAFVWVTKRIVERARPEGGLIDETGFSFPSGHAAVSVVFFYVLYLTVRPHIRNAYMRKAAFVMALAMPLAIGWSRVYLGVHYLTDILGGFVFGAIVVSIAILSGHSHERNLEGAEGHKSE